MKAFVSWSGGKDSALACYRAHQSADIEVADCVNMLNEESALSRSHHIPAELLRYQGTQMEITVTQIPATWDTYETRFKEVLARLKEKGVDSGIFGDIDVEEHRDWVERVCSEAGITPVLPLWQCDREELMDEFITAGFRAIVVATDARFLGKEWLGREVDPLFRAELRKISHVDLCGEKGEYHTFVYDGPLFIESVPFSAGEPQKIDNHWFLPLAKVQE